MGRPTKESEQRQVKREKADRIGDTTQAIVTHFQRGQFPKLRYQCSTETLPCKGPPYGHSKAVSPLKLKRMKRDSATLSSIQVESPRDIIRGCLHMTAGSGYVEARRLLDKRYGDEDSITSAFVDMVMDWPVATCKTLRRGGVGPILADAHILQECHERDIT